MGAVLMMVAVVPAAARDTGPVAAVKETIAEAVPVFKNNAIPKSQRDAKLKSIAAEHFDFPYMARSTMGTHWRQLTPDQRKEFVPLFTTYVMNTYLDRLQTTAVEAAGKGLSDKVTQNGPGDVLVHGEVRMPQLTEPLKVDYALHQTGGTWKLYDIVIDNVSTIAAYRDQFNKTMNESGYSKLVSEIRTGRQPPPSLPSR